MSTNSPEPRNQNEARIARARAGMAAADHIWKQPVATRKSDASAVPGPASHVSCLGMSTMKSAAPTISQKANDLAALPASVREKVKNFDAGQRALVVHVFSTHSRTGRPVPIDAGEAAKLMNSTPEKAHAIIGVLETTGLISRSYSTLGPLLGFVPAIGA